MPINCGTRATAVPLLARRQSASWMLLPERRFSFTCHARANQPKATEATIARASSQLDQRCDGAGREACRRSAPSSKATIALVRSFSTNSRPALRAASGRPPARQRHGGHRGTDLTLHLGGTNPRRTSPTTSEAGGRRRASVALPPGRLNVLLRAIPAGRALVMEPALACPTTTPPKPRPHRLDPVQHARPPLTPTVLHARPNNKKSTKM
jgi:hypothetical protein